MNLYKLLDCGNQKKVEQFGDFKLIRPCPQALWKPFDESLWENADSEFVRTSSEIGKWEHPSGKKLPKNWEVESENDLRWKIEPNEFGNLGVFTEHWSYAPDLVNFFKKEAKILNLFTYSGSNCLSLVRDGLKVTAVDSSKSAMDTYTYNINLNNLDRRGQKLILEDVYKFISREIRRGSKYNGIMMDAPSYGRGTKGEVFKIEDDLVKLLETCKQLIEPDGKIIVTLHSPRFTPMNLKILCEQMFPGKSVQSTEILQNCQSGVQLPSGFLVKIF